MLHTQVHGFLQHSYSGLIPNVNMVGIFYVKQATRLIHFCDNTLFHIFKLNFIH